MSEVLDEIAKDGIFYDESGGGVTISGGEPLSQPAFLMEILKGCRARGIHTVLDTTGFGPSAALLETVPWVNLYLYDIKLINEARHKQWTGVSNELILRNLKLLDQKGAAFWIRLPLIPGINDTKADLADLGRFCSTLSGTREIRLLPYHKTGIAKLHRLGQKYRLSDVEPPSEAYLEKVIEQLRAFGLGARVER